MKAEIISIGDELLVGQVVNTNASWIAEQLNLSGIEVVRIVAIADTWDAMTSDRIYRQGMSEEVALAILEREKHLGQWDPYLIDEFIKLIRHEHGFDPFDQTS